MTLYFGLFLLGLAFGLAFRPIVKITDKLIVNSFSPDTEDYGERWPHEPCGRSLEQCPYNKAEHIEYFQHRGDKPHPLMFR